jgi:hypothetical protein
MPDIYDIDYNTQYESLSPPNKRKPKLLAWGYSLMYPLQWLRDLFFDDYAKGTAYQDWDAVSGFAQFSRVRYSDLGNYECINPAGAVGALQNPLNTDYWRKIQDNYIGANERVKYNSQIIVLEYALNRWFMNAAPSDLIYISTNVTTSQLLMGGSSATSGNLSNYSAYSSYFMGYTYSATQYDFTVYFPIALYTALPPALNADKDKMIRNVVDKYKLTGMNYDIQTF